ncbi:hypothetical protein HGQ85_16480 [Clostridioides difficile]|nr:hypothetical protein [Clostridioides difficile]
MHYIDKYIEPTTERYLCVVKQITLKMGYPLETTLDAIDLDSYMMSVVCKALEERVDSIIKKSFNAESKY